MTRGGVDELWGGAPWQANELTDENVLLELRNVGAGGDCADESETSVDLVAVRLHYKPLEQTNKASPGTAHAPNGQWTDPTNAETSDDADATGTAGQAQGYSDFGFGIPTASIIIGIEVQVEAHSSDAGGDCELHVELSGDGGTSYPTAAKVAVLSGSDVVYVLGGLEDLWAGSWSVANLSDANFVVRVTAVDPNGCEDLAITSLDHLQVNVFYKAIADTDFESPAATRVPNGNWTDPTNAETSNDADATGTADQAQGYGDFWFTIPASAAVSGIEVRVDAHSSDAGGAC